MDSGCCACEGSCGVSYSGWVNKRVLMSEKVAVIFASWVVFVMVITGEEDLEFFFVLIFIGLLVLRELSDVFVTRRLKNRMNLFIYVFLIFFVVIVGNKVLTILGI